MEKTCPSTLIWAQSQSKLLEGGCLNFEFALYGCKNSVKATVENPRGTLLGGQLFHSSPRIFNSSSDYQNHYVHWRMKPVLTLPLSTLWGLTLSLSTVWGLTLPLSSAVTVWINCGLFPVMCGQLNLTLLPIDVCSLLALILGRWPLRDGLMIEKVPHTGDTESLDVCWK